HGADEADIGLLGVPYAQVLHAGLSLASACVAAHAVWTSPAAPDLVVFAAVGEARVAQAGADGHHAPVADVRIVGHFAQSLNHRIVVNQDERFVAADPRHVRGQGGGEIESLAFPVAGKILATLEDRPMLVDEARTADTDERSQLQFIFGRALDQLGQ